MTIPPSRPSGYGSSDGPPRTWRPGPQPWNQIAATAAEQLRRARRPRSAPPDHPVTLADLRRAVRRLRRELASAITILAERAALAEGDHP